jgi:hypothetical protein
MAHKVTVEFLIEDWPEDIAQQAANLEHLENTDVPFGEVVEVSATEADDWGV